MLISEYEGESMQTLAMVKHSGKFIVTKIKGEKALSRRLSEIGMTKGKVITVLSGNHANSGLVIVFQGQRLALSSSMAACIFVATVADPKQAQLSPLAQIKLHTPCLVAKITGDKAVRQRLMDMGLTKNTLVTIDKVAPLGDPLELSLRGYKLSIRNFEAQSILVQEVNVSWQQLHWQVTPTVGKLPSLTTWLVQAST